MRIGGHIALAVVMAACHTAVSVSEEIRGQEQCGLWLAESTIPGAGLGMFVGVELEEGVLVEYPDNAIAIWDMAWHTNNWEGDEGSWEVWQHYLMNYFHRPDSCGMGHEGEDSEATHIFIPGVGGIPSCHYALNNIEEAFFSADEPVAEYDNVGLHRSRDPGAGAFSGYYRMPHRTMSKIPAGAELFGDYGRHWFQERLETLGWIPFEENYDEADNFLRLYYGTFLRRHNRTIHEELEKDLWELITSPDDDDDTLFRKNQTLFRRHGSVIADTDQLGGDLAHLILKIPSDPRTRSALPKSVPDAHYALEVGIVEHELRKSIRSQEWLQRNGKCMDNIRPGKSTIPQAGWGAFATRFIPDGGLVGPAPLLHIPNRDNFDMKGAGGDEDDGGIAGRQLLLNYCFGHRRSSLLLCPYGSATGFINHNGLTPNAKVVWANDSPSHDPGCLTLSPESLCRQWNTCAVFDYVATRDIQPGEEIFIDYGREWEEAWKAHVRDWSPPPDSENYLRASDLNKDLDTPIRTREEQSSQPYSDNVEIFCYYSDQEENNEEDGDESSDLYPCDIVSRKTVDDTLVVYSAEITLPDEQMAFVEDIPREKILLIDSPYTGDEHLPTAFRHEMMIPDDIFPEAWMNIPAKVVEEDGSEYSEGEEEIEEEESTEIRQEEEDETNAARQECPNDSEGSFLAPQLGPGEVSPLQWREDGKRAAEYAIRVGIPPQLTKEVRDYCDRIGVTDLYRSLEYPDPITPGQYRFVELGGHKWFASRPESKWKSNMHWVSPANEATHEDYLKVLAAGGFDVVLDAIGRHFNLDSLAVHGVGFIGVSHCSKGYVHQDMTGTGGKFFNVLFPLVLEDGAPPEFIVYDDEDNDRVGAAKYEYDIALVVGDDAYHGTAACDYRATKGMRMAATIYIADINDDNVDVIAADSTQVFPVPDSTRWANAQKARHWGGGNRLVGDRGRKPFSAEDEWDSCPQLAKQGKCETDAWNTRMNCLKSCKVYLED